MREAGDGLCVNEGEAAGGHGPRALARALAKQRALAAARTRTRYPALAARLGEQARASKLRRVVDGRAGAARARQEWVRGVRAPRAVCPPREGAPAGFMVAEERRGATAGGGNTEGSSGSLSFPRPPSLSVWQRRLLPSYDPRRPRGTNNQRVPPLGNGTGAPGNHPHRPRHSGRVHQRGGGGGEGVVASHRRDDRSTALAEAFDAVYRVLVATLLLPTLDVC